MKNKKQITTILFATLCLTTFSAKADSSCGSMSDMECSMAQAINKVRLQYKLSPLKVSNSCVAEAQEHAKDMDVHGYFSHDGLNEKWIDRMERFGLTHGSVGENISQGYDIPAGVKAWMNSPPHRKNILSPQYKSTGVGYSNKYWVQCFSSEPGN